MYIKTKQTFDKTFIPKTMQVFKNQQMGIYPYDLKAGKNKFKLLNNIKEDGIKYLHQIIQIERNSEVKVKVKQNQTRKGKQQSKYQFVSKEPMPKYVTQRGFYIYYEYYEGKNGLTYYYPRYSHVCERNRKIDKQPTQLLQQQKIIIKSNTKKLY